MGVRMRRRTTAGLHCSEGQGGAPPSASAMLGMVAVPGEEKGGFLDGEGWSGGRWEEAVVVRLGLCICKRVLDMGWISKVANSISDVFSIRHGLNDFL